MGKPCPHLLFYSTGGVRIWRPEGNSSPKRFVLPDPGDLHNMNHRVPAQRCLAGKSGLASLIIVRALALLVPRVSPAPASRGVFFAAVCFPAAAGSIGSCCQANTPSGAGASPGGCTPLPGALPTTDKAGMLPWVPTSPCPSCPALVGSGCLRGCLGTGSVAPRSVTDKTQVVPKREEGLSDQGRYILGAGLGWGWVVCMGMEQRAGRCQNIAAPSVRMGRFLPPQSCDSPFPAISLMPSTGRHVHAPGTRAKGQGRTVGCIWGVILCWLFPL